MKSYVNLKHPIYSFTLKELRDNEDGSFIHRSEKVKELESPVLEFCYCNTAKFKIKSSEFGKQVKMKDGTTGVNQTWYNIFVLFEDFYTIGSDKNINFEDAIDYAINYADVKIRCNCKSFLYWGFSYQGTELDYLYGIPREYRYPIVRNPNLRSVACKHCDVVIDWILRNKELLAKMFAEYYNRLNDGQSIYAVNANGTTITIGKKNGENDIFFEQQQEELPEDESVEDETVETEEDNVIEDESVEESEETEEEEGNE